jgi:hypothetical protein
MKNSSQFVERFFHLKDIVFVSYLGVLVSIISLLGSFIIHYDSVALTLIVLLLCGVLAIVLVITRRKMKELRVKLSDMFDEIHTKSVNIRTGLQILKGDMIKNSTGIVFISPRSKYGKPVVEAIDFLDSLSPYGHSDYLPQFDADPGIHGPFFYPTGLLKNEFMSLLDEVCDLIDRKAKQSRDLKNEWSSKPIDSDLLR